MESVTTIINLIKDIALFPLSVSLLIYLISVIISDYNITSIEEKLMKPKKRVILPFASLLIMSIVLTVITIFFTVDEFRKSYIAEVKNYIEFNTYLLFFGLFLIILIFVVMLLCYVVFFILKVIIALNYSYYTTDNQRVIRVNSDSYLLVESNGIYEFLEEPFKYKYYSEVVSQQWKVDSYEDSNVLKKLFWGIIGAIILLLVILIFAFLNDKIVESYLAFLSIIVMIIFGLIGWGSKKEYEIYKEKVNKREQSKSNTSEK